MTAPIGGSSAPRIASTQVEEAPSHAEATAIWQSELNAEVAERAKAEPGSFAELPQHRVDAYKAKVAEDMAKFVQQTPAPSEDDIRKAAQESIKKHSTHETLGKMEFEFFIKKMSSRMQELSADMWK
jgi:hypothetical protein